MVKLSDLGDLSKHAGLYVCQNGGEEIKLANALKKAKISARVLRSTVDDYGDYCVAKFGEPQSLRIFVGQRVIPIHKR